MKAMNHYYSVDLESPAHSTPWRGQPSSNARRKQLDSGATPGQVKSLLALLADQGKQLTFFVTSEVFDWYPTLIESIADRGHEIAFHTHSHRLLRQLTDLEEEVEAAERFLRTWRPEGFRAPYMHMLPAAYNLLKKRGFRYSSSVYGSQLTFTHPSGIVEVPVSTYSYRNRTSQPLGIPRPMSASLWTEEIPYGSGYVLGLLGWRYVNGVLVKREKSGLFSNMFIHSWQLFGDSFRSVLKQYLTTLRYPLHAPYARLVVNDFIKLLGRHDFVCLKAHPLITTNAGNEVIQ